MNKGKILIISGPSGCGKSTVLNIVFGKLEKYFFSISATTRKPRKGEKDGVDYYFITREQFEKMLDEGEFLEHAEFVGNYYGTPLKPLYDHANAGYSVFLDIETNGFLQVKDKIPEAVSIFIAPPSLEVLEARLRGRGTESDEAIDGRLNTVRHEMSMMDRYDHVVINDDANLAAQKIIDIINA